MPQTIYAEVPDCPCCGETAGCFLTIPTALLDGDPTPYADETAATAAIADRAAGCMVEMVSTSPPDHVRTSETTSFTGGVLSWHTTTTLNGMSGGFEIGLVRLQFAGPATLSIRNVATFGSSNPGPYSAGFNAELYDDSLGFVDADGAGGTSLTYDHTINLTIPAAGTYYLLLNAGGGEEGSSSGNGTSDTLFEISADEPFTPCTIRAAHGETPDYVVCTP